MTGVFRIIPYDVQQITWTFPGHCSSGRPWCHVTRHGDVICCTEHLSPHCRVPDKWIFTAGKVGRQHFWRSNLRIGISPNSHRCHFLSLLISKKTTSIQPLYESKKNIQDLNSTNSGGISSVKASKGRRSSIATKPTDIPWNKWLVARCC